MINHFEASVLMNDSIKRGMSFIKENGFLYPFFYLLKAGSPMDVSLFSNPALLNIQQAPPKTSRKIHGVVAAFRDAPKIGKNTVNERAKEIVRLLQPDVFGMCVVVFYKDAEESIIKRIAKDPDVIRNAEATKALHACYFVRGDKKASQKLIPMLDRGPIKESSELSSDSVPSFLDEEREEAPSPKLDITLVDSSWLKETTSHPAYVRYPF